MISLLLFFISFVVLWKSSDLFVDASVSIARYYKLSPIVIGATIVAFGTSAPELFVNLFAAYGWHGNIVYGNILGSNIANTLLIFGVAVCLTRIKINPDIKKQVVLNLLILLLMVVIFYFQLNSVFISVMILGVFVYLNIKLLKSPSNGENQLPRYSIRMSYVWFIIGLVFLSLSSKLMIDSLLKTSEFFGISSTFLSLFAVALGTSLPELASTIMFVRKGHSEMVVGNILGSNMFNLMFVIPLSWLVNRLVFTPNFLLECGLLVIMSSVLLGVVYGRRIIFRVIGSGFLMVYVGYIVFIYLKMV